MTVIQNIIDYVTDSVLLPDNTVDRLQFGNPDDEVKTVVVTFLAGQKIIKEAVRLGANLIISHEGIFYRHRDMGEEQNLDPVYQQKFRTISEGRVAVFRLHDAIHRAKTDGITRGLLLALDWSSYEVFRHQHYSILEIPELPLGEIIGHIKRCLGLEYLRYMGEPDMPCKKIGVLVGYRGSAEVALPLYQQYGLDLLIYGEGPEWETPEYVRDSLDNGKKRALVVLGHAESEAPGMKCLAADLQEKFPDIPVHFISQRSVFSIR